MWKHVSEDFNPGIVFVRRQDMDQRYATIGVHARPKWKGIQEVAPYVEVDHIADLRGQLATRTVQAGVDLLFQPDGNVKFDVKDQFDRLDAPFTVVPGYAVPIGAYAWREAEVSYTRRGVRGGCSAPRRTPPAASTMGRVARPGRR